MKRFLRIRTLLLCCVAASLTSCDMYTSIKRQDNGQYVLTLQQAAKVLVADYDSATKTMTIRERK